LGNLYAAQIFERIEQDLPSMWSEIGQGNFTSLLNWLRIHIHQVGRRKLAPELIQEITEEAPSSAAYLRYLEGKYGALYGLQ
jgi:carboxypeptidase Taq